MNFLKGYNLDDQLYFHEAGGFAMSMRRFNLGKSQQTVRMSSGRKRARMAEAAAQIAVAKVAQRSRAR